ncbi:hypothetical protein Taro_048122, partial [Colocasia esculenta]|nr:hypothetical protein [Colocasia esculenta]
MWCGLLRCRAVTCGSGQRCPCLVGSLLVVGSASLLKLVVNSGEVLPEFFSVDSGGERLLTLWVEVLPKLSRPAWALSVKVWCLDRVFGCGAGQVVFLFVFRFPGYA